MARPASDQVARIDLALYLVTDTRLCGGAQGVVDTVAAAVAGGVTAVQLRDPDARPRDLVALGRRLVEELDGTGIPLLVNDRADIAATIGADGVHLGQDDLPVSAARALLGPGALVGWSVHVPHHLTHLADLPAGTVDYLGVGPVFPQRTKADAAPPGGLDVLAEIAVKADLPCVAIGGVTVANAAAVRAAGAAGIAVVSAICGRDDPEMAARDLRRAWQSEEAR